MDDIIQILPESVANQIAAGEVIQRPASVIKELMENAIDAGATRIDVRVKDAGRTMIQVLDDGKGMSPQDARTCFGRHATSKLRQANDLFHLTTMGFRGEALASIAAVAYVELVTRRPQDELAWKVEIEGTTITNEEPTISATGTRITVRNLFYNIPARRKFLGDNAKEFRFIRDEFIQIALVNPDLELSLINNDEVIYQLSKNILRQRVLNLFGKRSNGQLNKMLYSVEVATQLVTITGFVGDPSSACRRDPLQYFFVNGRFIRHKFFRSAVLKAYETLIPAGMQPTYFLYLEVDPEALDVNIHPTKTEVKFENEQAIWPIVNATVREALGKYNAVPSIDFDQEDAPEIRVFTGERSVKPPSINFDPTYNPFKTTTAKNHNPNWDALFKDFQKSGNKDNPYASGLEDALHDSFKEVESLFTDGQEEGSLRTDHGSLFGKDQLLIDSNAPKFQLFNSFIAVYNARSIVFIDQHRAHIRILYDRYMKQQTCGKSASQTLLFPVELHLDAGQRMDLNDMIEDFQSLGFKLDIRGEIVQIVAVPVDTSGIKSDYLVLDLMNSIKENGSASLEERHASLALRLAKAAAIPSGQVMSFEEMEVMIAKLNDTAEQKYTPDGKSICNWLSAEELFKRF